MEKELRRAKFIRWQMRILLAFALTVCWGYAASLFLGYGPASPFSTHVRDGFMWVAAGMAFAIAQLLFELYVRGVLRALRRMQVDE